MSIASTTAKADATILQTADLAYSEEWLKLLHYKEKIGGGYQGLVDNDDFYTSENGRDEPLQELENEIKLFNDAQDKTKCEFPARFFWLKEQNLVKGDLSACQEYNDFLKDVQPDGITILFTDAFMSNPASLFGHTLIRIDTARKGSQMLAHGSNFGADSGTDNGAEFAIKGLFGGYYGTYAISPYWDVINAYNNIENRDIWEYHLNLSAEQQQRFVNHLYEMKNAKVRYFFLNKNCSYMILELIEAVRPELDLTSGYNYQAIPLDTLKTIKSVPDLVDNVNYRPARYTKLQAQIRAMNDKQLAAFKKGIIEHDYDMENLSPEEKPLVLEAEYQYYQYVYTAQDMELAEYRKNSFAVLRQRSSLPAAESIKPEGKDPSLSHASFQVSVGGGIDDKQSFEQLNVRPAYTSITDDNWGLIKGAGISVMESKWRYYNQSHKLHLHNFTAMKIVSYVPADSVFSPWSYTTDMNIHREYNPQNANEGYVGELVFSLGKTYALSDWFWLYATLGGRGQYGGFLDGNHWVGATPTIGVFNDFGPLKTNFSIEKTFASRLVASRLLTKAEVGIMLSKDISLNAMYQNSHNESGHDRQEISAFIRYSF